MAKTNHAGVGVTAGAVMSQADRMITSSPTKAEAARRIEATIGHLKTRLSSLSWYWTQGHCTCPGGCHLNPGQHHENCECVASEHEFSALSREGAKT